MRRTQQLNHSGKMIYYMDFTNMKEIKDIKSIIEESINFIRKQSPSSVLTLTAINDMHFNNEIRDTFNEFIKGNKPYVKAGAVVGLSGLQRIVYNGLMKLTGRDIKSFDNLQSAKDWLASFN